MKTMKVAFAVLALSLSGCMITKMSLSPKWDPASKPSYVDYADYYWWGLKGRREFNLQRICVDQKPYGFERRRSAEDGIIALFTAGIYAPATIRVWCGD
jgi:hypothetical protein